MSYFDILGFKCRDVVTGFTGVAESLAFDLYGCVEVALRPMRGKDAKPDDYPTGRWFAYARLQRIGKKPVMPAPSFDVGDKGPADKPGQSSLPSR